MLLREEIEQSFGDGPAHRPIEELVATGRRRVRRRRAAGVGAALATVAVLGATYAVTAPGSGGSGAPPIASDPSGSTGVTPGEISRTTGGSMSMGDATEEVTLTEDGRLVIGADVKVLDRVDNPKQVNPPEYSIAVDVTIDGERQWMFLTAGPDSGSGAAQSVGDHPGQKFRDWVHEWAEARIGSPVGGSEPEVEDPDEQGVTSEGSGSNRGEQ
jgi:hypothetical protein